LKFLASFPVQEPSNISRGSKIVEASCMVGLERGCKKLGVEVSLKKQRKKGHWHVLDTKSEPPHWVKKRHNIYVLSHCIFVARI
jgi:hypothetical protein